MELALPLADIHNQALTAARAASRAAYDSMGGDRFACGFAWVNVSGVKLSTKLGKEFARLGFRKSYSGGIELWNPGGMSVQNIDIKEAGAVAYAEVLRRYGIQAFAGSRLD
jgi:hypothetical protein